MKHSWLIVTAYLLSFAAFGCDSRDTGTLDSGVRDGGVDAGADAGRDAGANEDDAGAEEDAGR
jgi:hypothetical protein